MKKFFLVIFLVFLFSCGMFSKSSFAKELPIFDLGETVVTGTREPTSIKSAPGNVSVITAKEIKEIHPITTGEIIRNLAGVHVLSNGSPGQITMTQIRGSFSTQVLVLLDGRPINIPSLGSADLAGIPPDIIDRIEVVKGPYSALYGANAMAGVINIITKKGDRKEPFKFDFSCGSYSTLKTCIELTIPAGDGNLMLLGNIFNTEGTRQNSAVRQQDINFRFNTPLKNGNLTCSGGWHTAKIGTPGTQPSAIFAKRTLTQQIMGNNEISTPLDNTNDSQGYLNFLFNRGNLTWQFYLTTLQPTYHFQYLQTDFFGNAQMQIENDSSRTGIASSEIRYRFRQTEKSFLTIGATWENSTFSYDQNLFNQATGELKNTRWSAQRVTTAYYLEENWDTGPVLINLGLRTDNPSDFASQVSPRAGLLWKMNKDTRLRVSYGKAYRAPTLNDLAWPADLFSRGNPNLNPEKSDSFEISIETSPGKTFLGRLAYFNENVKDMIAWAPTGPMGVFGNIWQPSNLNELKKNGIEVEVRWRPVERFTLKGTYSSLDATQTNNELVDALNNILTPISRVAANIPRKRAALDLSYNTGLFNILLRGEYSDEKYQYYQNWNNWPVVTMDTKTIPSYSVFDLYLSRKIKLGKNEGNLFFNFYNIFNQEYALNFGSDINDRNYPMPGRSINMGFSARL